MGRMASRLNLREDLTMTEFYVFYESGALAFTTSDEDYASVWCDENNGYYCCDEE